MRGVSASMKTSTWALWTLALGFGLPIATAHAQTSQRGQPTTAFAPADLAKLRWLEGSWEGTAPGEPAIYERYHFANDSTIEITYYRDPEFARETGSGRVYLSVGRLYHTFGRGAGARHTSTRTECSSSRRSMRGIRLPGRESPRMPGPQRCAPASVATTV